jgi:hypothetical protein
MIIAKYIGPMLLLCVGGGRLAQASPLPPEVCGNLRTEVQNLEQGGLRATIARGPESAKTSLTPEQLNHIRRLLDLDAQLKFRCPTDRAAVVLKDVAAEDNPDAPGYSSETEVGGAVVPAKPKPKQVLAKPSVPKANPANVETTTDASPAPTKAAPRQKPAAKTDDAYRPPTSGDVNGTPLQKQAPVKSTTP